MDIERENTQNVEPGLPIEDMEKAVSTVRIKGEIVIAIASFIFGSLGYYYAIDMTHDTYSSPAVFPKLVSTIIVICGLIQTYRCYKKNYVDFGLSAFQYIFPSNILFTIPLLIICCVIMPKVHFAISSFAFMSILMVYLDGVKYVLRSVIIACLSTAALIFRYIFEIILP